MTLTPMTDLEAFAHNYALQSEEEFVNMNAHTSLAPSLAASGFMVVGLPTHEVPLSDRVRCAHEIHIRSHAPHITSQDRMHRGTITSLVKEGKINLVAACIKGHTNVVFTFDSLLTAIAWFKEHDAGYDRNDYDLVKFKL